MAIFSVPYKLDKTEHLLKHTEPAVYLFVQK